MKMQLLLGMDKGTIQYRDNVRFRNSIQFKKTALVIKIRK